MAILIQVSELSLFTDDKEPLLQNISFSVEEGDITVISGLPPSSQSALLNTLIGEITPDSGQILLVGRNVVRISRKKILAMRKEDIGFLPARFSFPERTVHDCLRFKMEALGQPYETPTKIDETLQQIGLKQKGDSLPGDLSLLERRKLAIGLSIVNRPALLVCEEPFRELNREAGESLLELLTNLRDDRDITTLLAVSDFTEHEAVTTIQLNGGRPFTP
ncbi:MAG: ATP-binding cassette domain-containing protein [Candidatus Bipolaricaulota bacterium]